MQFRAVLAQLLKAVLASVKSVLSIAHFADDPEDIKLAVEKEVFSKETDGLGIAEALSDCQSERMVDRFLELHLPE
jgi:hypothetical protein